MLTNIFSVETFFRSMVYLLLLALSFQRFLMGRFVAVVHLYKMSALCSLHPLTFKEIIYAVRETTSGLYHSLHVFVAIFIMMLYQIVKCISNALFLYCFLLVEAYHLSWKSLISSSVFSYWVFWLIIHKQSWLVNACKFYQDICERYQRRSNLLLHLKQQLEDLDIEYQLPSQEISVKGIPMMNMLDAILWGSLCFV